MSQLTKFKQSDFFQKGESYLLGQSRQINSYLAGHVQPNTLLFGGTCPIGSMQFIVLDNQHRNVHWQHILPNFPMYVAYDLS